MAETCQKLPEFVEWVKKAKKTPNLTKFAEATMPKGRGRKGGSCPRKRKAPETVETRVTNPAFTQHVENSSEQGDKKGDEDADFSSCQDLSNLLSVAQTGPNSQSTVKLSNNSIMWPSFAPLRPKSPSWPYGTYSPLHSSFSPSDFSSQSHSLSPPAFSSQSYSPFTLCKITGNISKYFGCCNKYAKNPTPP